jgi:hypothetical protein
MTSTGLTTDTASCKVIKKRVFYDRGGDHLPSMWFDLQRGLPNRDREHQRQDRPDRHDVQERRCGVRDPDQIPPYLIGPCLMKECCFQHQAAGRG